MKTIRRGINILIILIISAICFGALTIVATATTDGAAQHTWNEGTVKIRAKCETAGVKLFKCTDTGCDATKEEKIDPLGHEYEVEVVAPKCETEGGTVYYCIRCDHSYAEDIVPPTGHTYTEWEEHHYLDCEVEGYAIRSCIVCNSSWHRSIPALGHRFADEFTIDKKASFGECGSMSKHCTVSGCRGKGEVTEIPALVSTIPENAVYDGTEHRPPIQIKEYSGLKLTEGVDYVVEYSDNVNAGAGKIEVKILPNDRYRGSMTVHFIIAKAAQSIPVDVVKVRAKKAFAIDTSNLVGTISFKSANKRIATVNYNTGVIKGIRPGTTTVTVVATGGRNHASFEKKIKVVVPSAFSKASLSKYTFTYNGSDQRPKIKSINGKTTLVEGKDYTVQWPEESIEPGTYKVVITATEDSKFYGKITKKYTIKKPRRK